MSDTNHPGPKRAETGRAETGPAGLAARRAAVRAVQAVMARTGMLEATLESAPGFAAMEARDRAFARLIAATAIRRIGQIDAALDPFLKRKPEGAALSILRCAAAELLFLKAPAHAAVSMAVTLAGSDRRTAPFKGLVNAVARRVAERGADLAAAVPADRNLPGWLRDAWEKAYGAAGARALAEASMGEPPLDLTAKSDPSSVADMTGGAILPGGSVRLTAGGRVTDIPGFADGHWWVQDAASAVPARLLGAAPGMRVFDLCAAPGGKTLQLAAAGAHVTAVDASETRMKLVRDNLARVGLSADPVVADVLAWRPDGAPADAVLLDAPCTATGTLRRSPDAAWLRRPADLTTLTGVQARMLDRAADLLRPGGRLVYSVCSLQPEEGEGQIRSLLSRRADLRIDPATPSEAPGLEAAILPDGCLRILPSMWADSGGLDGFFIARLTRVGDGQGPSDPSLSRQ